jgi:hypothetical protein
MNQQESIATGYLGPVYQVAAINALPDGSQPDGRVPFVSRNHALLMPATAAVPISIPDTMRTLALLAESQAKTKRHVKKTPFLGTGGGSATAARPSRNAAVLDENEAQTVFDATRSYVDMIVDTCASQATFAMLASIKVNKLVAASATEEEDMSLGGFGGGEGGLVTVRTHLRPFEMYSIATLCPQSYDEAVTYCPTLRDYDAGSISDVLQLMYQQLQGTNNM